MSSKELGDSERIKRLLKHRKYNEEHKEERRNKARLYYQKNREIILQKQKAWRRLHPEEYRKRQQEYYQKNKETILARTAECRRKFKEKHGCSYTTFQLNKLRERILELLGNKCVHCGFSDKRALQIDHVFGGGNQERKRFQSKSKIRFGVTIRYYKHVLQQIKNGSKDYQLLCANCNIIKYRKRRK